MPSNQPVEMLDPIESISHMEGGMKILLVDDHAIVRVGLRQMLTDAFDKLDVTEVGTGQEALTQAQDSA